MTAAAEPEPGPHPLAAGASPAVVTQWLLPHDAERFIAEYRKALDDTRTSLELEVVERWRGIAILQTDPESYRRTVRHAAQIAPANPPLRTSPSRSPAPRPASHHVYVVEPVGEDVQASIEALPPELLVAFAELRATLEISPWTVGTPLVPSNPTGLRISTIGTDGLGQIVFHVIERDRIVPVVEVPFV